jgi:hypothetical protein
MKPRIVLFCGGRDCTQESHGEQIRADVSSLPKGSIVLHGGAKGADALADFYARSPNIRDLELHVARVPALWEVYGRSAGPRRNRAMMLLGPDFAFVYPTGGPGTQDMLALLDEAGVQHAVYEPVEASS